jgi:hypothetical protein
MKCARIFVLAALVLLPDAKRLRGQGPALGVFTLNNNGGSVPCPPGFNRHQMTCYSAMVSNCLDYTGATILPLGLTFGISKLPPATKGVVVLHAGNGGTAPLIQPGDYLASDIFDAGFQVVQIAWDTAWELLGSDGPYDVKGASCRPATFFQYIYQTYYFPIAGAASKPGYCLLGASAGAGAVGMYLAHYNGGAAVDKAEMWAGPQFADVQQGCEIPPAPPVTVCTNGNSICASGVTPWTYAPAYQNSYSNLLLYDWVGGGMNNTTNEACSNTHNISTSEPVDQNALWKNMSVVDGLGDVNFNYPNTNVSGYLCAYGNDGGNGGDSKNPSSQQGWIFYSQFEPGSVKALTVRSATCWKAVGSNQPDPETVEYASEVDNSTVPPLFGASCNHASYSTGYAALCGDMINNCLLNH